MAGHRPPGIRGLACAALLAVLASGAAALVAHAEGPALGPVRITQAMIENGELELLELRREGRRIFSTPFNRADGRGDERPMLGDNGTILRVNGLDSQSCLECHSVISNATIPARFGVGGVGLMVQNAIAGPTFIDVADSAGAGFATFDGRLINPPFLFGAGGVELVGKEMTRDLQQLRRFAEENPGQVVQLLTKGIDFGSIVHDGETLDTSGVVGIEPDLVVRPFGRKGEFETIRAFDVDALQFHHGMQPVEAVGFDVDPDQDGVVNEALIGELSALHIFEATMERPRRLRRGTDTQRGERLFEELQCGSCHVPTLLTESRWLPLAFPQVASDPFANEYYRLDLSRQPTGFRRAQGGGLRVPMFADLKRHDMGPELAEKTGRDIDPFFTTARLWGVADTAPYLHDGRAMTLTEAILMHGGEAQSSRDLFASLGDAERASVLAFLGTLRTPERVGEDLDE
jgi:hypothetical protein